MCRKLVDFLKRADMFGEEFEFNYKKEDRYRTNIGGILTLGGYAVIVFIAWRMITNYLDVANPQINSGVQFDRESIKMDLYKNNIYPIFSLTAPEGAPKVDDIWKYATFIGSISRVTYESLDKLDELKFETLARMEFRPCKDVNDPIKDIVISEEPMKTYIVEYSYCPFFPTEEDRANYFIEGNAIRPPFILLNIQIFPCFGRNGDYSECKPLEEIMDTQVDFLMPEFNFISEDKENPVKITPSLKLSDKLLPFVDKIKEVIMRQVEIYDDDQDISKESLKESYLEIDSTRGSFIQRGVLGTAPILCVEEDCEPYMEIEISSSQKKIIIKREYTKMLGSLSEFGGVEEIILVVIFTIYFITASYKFSRSMRKSIMGQNYEKDHKEFFEKDQKLLRKAQDAVVKQHSDGVSLFKGLKMMEILGGIYLKKHDKVLIPLVMLGIKQREIEKNQAKEEDKENSKVIFLFILSSPKKRPKAANRYWRN